ncbi:hypothetical protein P4O66_008116, partial [Electrophorus voltai]
TCKRFPTCPLANRNTLLPQEKTKDCREAEEENSPRFSSQLMPISPFQVLMGSNICKVIKFESLPSDQHKRYSIFSSLLNPSPHPASSSLTSEDFITFFEEKVAAIQQSFSSVPTLPTSVHSPTSKSLASLSPLSSDEILQFLNSSNPTTCQLDLIPSTLFQMISRDLLSFISVIINNSLSSGHVPTVFKTTRVVPILKKATLDSSSIANYRSNQLHDPYQSGYKLTHSTETAFIAVMEKPVAKAAKLSSVLILLDLSAAFDTVSHNIQLSVLSNLGVTGSAWKWFRSYLEGWSYQ